jgi:hypothetical protein
VGDDELRWRRAVRAEVLGGVCVSDEGHVVSADERAVDRGTDAGVGLSTGDHDTTDTALGEQRLEFGGFERITVLLVHQRLGIPADELRHVLPPLAPHRQVLARVLHPHDRHILGPGLLDQSRDVRDDLVATGSSRDHPVLDVDDQQRGVWPVGQRRHGSILSVLRECPS